MIETVLVPALQAALGAARVFPAPAPEKTIKPYITYQHVGGRVVNMLDQNDHPGKSLHRVQINVWGEKHVDVRALARTVENTLRTTLALQTTVLTEPIDQPDPETGLRGTRQDFHFWY